MAETRRLFWDYVEDGSVAGLIYFSWGYGPWSVYRCNELTSAGELAIRGFD
jgi:hypothetical protein